MIWEDWWFFNFWSNFCRDVVFARALQEALGNKFCDHHYLFLHVSLSECKLHGEATVLVSLITGFPPHSTSVKYMCWINALLNKTSRKSTEKLLEILKIFNNINKVASYKVIMYSPQISVLTNLKIYWNQNFHSH